MITLTWSWLAFFVGIFATLTVQFWLVIFFAFKQWKKQRAATKNVDSIDKLFATWGGRDNNSNK
jgi:hypothetical protein